MNNQEENILPPKIGQDIQKEKETIKKLWKENLCPLEALEIICNYGKRKRKMKIKKK